MKVLILGSQGMLGQELMRVYGEDPGYEVVGWDRDEIDLADFGVAETKIREYAPDIIVNAVAYNAVDLCEENEEEYRKAILLNAEMPRFLAKLAREINATWLHYSTDYVFDGTNEEGYSETATPNPISRYGVSKYTGERAVIEGGGKYYLVRLSKLFGKPATSAVGKKSFFEKMKGLAQTNHELQAVDDELSCFTYAPDLAVATKVMIQHVVPYGIYHLVNEDPATWYEATKELFRLAKKDVIVKPVPASAFPRPAKRPHCSILRNTKFIPFRPYTEALAEFLKK
ncbi:MAG: dTDP-4-dehydrorhamnose reductase [Candidatus Moraniibacteriota bacterium]